MQSMLKVAVLCLGSLATVSAAEAMPAVSQFADPATVSVGGAQVDKAVVIVNRRVVRRRPAIIVRRPMHRVIRRTTIIR